MGIIIFIYVLISTLIKASKAEAYMSTRISANEELGWTMKDNLALGKARAEACGDVINPGDTYIKGWSNKQYMVLWVIVIRAMALMGKTMYSYKVDLCGSMGCIEEVELANTIGMQVVTVVG